MIACVGGGSNAIGTFVPFVEDEGVELVGVEAAGEGLETGRHGAPLTVGGPGGMGGVLHGAFSAIMQDEDGQILEAHSISAGLDYPGTGPEHAWLRDSGRATLRGGDRRAGACRVPAAVASSRASSRRSSPPTRSPGCSPTRPSGADLVCLSGRGDKDLAEALRPWGSGDRRPTGAGPPGPPAAGQRIAAAFDGHGRRAALMPYMMGGFPDIETSLAIGEAYAEAGADLVELGVPFSDPLADGPVIQAAATRALAAGATLPGVLERRAGAGRARPGRAHVLREPDPGPRRRALRARARRARGSAA